jgi:hypothetical protein
VDEGVLDRSVTDDASVLRPYFLVRKLRANASAGVAQPDVQHQLGTNSRSNTTNQVALCGT